MQELLAPTRIEFYDRNRHFFGDRVSLAKDISTCTGIRESVLLEPDCAEDPPCVAEQMYWASKRKTTRSEDEAYCLLGLFDVNMPLLYGEGRVKAFLRLQEEIITRSNDETIFAWTTPNVSCCGMLATSPSEFANSGYVRRRAVQARSRFLPVIANFGLEISINNLHDKNVILALLCDWICDGPTTTRTVPIAAILTGAPTPTRINIDLCRPHGNENVWKRQSSTAHRTRPQTPYKDGFAFVFGWLFDSGKILVALHAPQLQDGEKHPGSAGSVNVTEFSLPVDVFVLNFVTSILGTEDQFRTDPDLRGLVGRIICIFAIVVSWHHYGKCLGSLVLPLLFMVTYANLRSLFELGMLYSLFTLLLRSRWYDDPTAGGGLVVTLAFMLWRAYVYGLLQ